MGVTRRVSLDETDNQKDDGEDKGADGQHEVAHHPAQGILAKRNDIILKPSHKSDKSPTINLFP